MTYVSLVGEGLIFPSTVLCASNGTQTTHSKLSMALRQMSNHRMLQMPSSVASVHVHVMPLWCHVFTHDCRRSTCKTSQVSVLIGSIIMQLRLFCLKPLSEYDCTIAQHYNTYGYMHSLQPAEEWINKELRTLVIGKIMQFKVPRRMRVRDKHHDNEYAGSVVLADNN